MGFSSGFRIVCFVVLSAVACAAEVPHADRDGQEANGTLSGEIRRMIADRDDGTSETAYFIRLRDGSERRLIFARDPELAPRTRVELSGRSSGDAFVVSGFAIDFGARPQALLAVTPVPTRRFAFVLVDTGAGVNLTTAAARQVLFDANFFMVGRGSVRRYYQEESYGIQDISGDVFGPFSYAPKATCDTSGVAAALRAQVDQLAGAPSDHYLWYFGSRQTGCGFQGAAVLGSPARPEHDTWYNGASGCSVLVQEPGHNLGLQHSSSMVCPGNQSFADVPDGACAHNEYGDLFDTMGSGCRQMNGWQKSFQGWLQACNVVKATASGTFNLLPLESACDGIQLIQVPMPRARPFTHSGGGGDMVVTDTLTSYYVELRAPVGFDQGLPPMVLVHVAADRRDSFSAGLHTWLLDMTPNTTTFSDAALPAGQTFRDPAGGVSITAVSVSAARASIQVDVSNGSGAPTCLDGTTLAAPGPATCGSIVAGTGGTPGTGGSPADSGTGGAGGGGGEAAGDAAAPADAAREVDADQTVPTAAASGCSCRVAPPPPTAVPVSAAVGWLILTALLLRRRGRR